MKPRLVVLEGPLKGSEIPIEQNEIIIGRDPSVQVPIPDPSLSRKHCRIQCEGEEFTIADLDSLNGTFVDRIAVRSNKLEHGNRIEIGDSALLFLTEDFDPAADTPAYFDSHTGWEKSTILLRPEDQVYLHPQKSHSGAERDLNALIAISNRIHHIQDSKKLQENLLEQIFSVVPAERGGILVAGKDATDVHSFIPYKTKAPKMQISRTVLNKVLKARTALLCSDVGSTAELQDSRSLAQANTSSVLVVPFISSAPNTTVLYLETSNQASPFTEHHLQFVSAAAAIASVALDNARRFELLESENLRLRQEIDPQYRMIGEGAAMESVYELIRKVAPVDSTVLIQGENGTGKELVARAIHLSSPRANKPFIAVNCAALTETLMESELFGHEKGSFTGAIGQKKGKFELADGGTLFLDEVAEIATALQSKLLRALQEREFERVGGTKPVRVDVRVIAATNRNLTEEIQNGKFRQDLFYRLNVVSIAVPPLRKRKEDIPVLSAYFASKFSHRFNKSITGLSKEAEAYLMNYDWPGNVRELQNAIERAVVLTQSETILADDLPEGIVEKEPPPQIDAGKYHDSILQLKKDLILNAFREAKGNYTEAAKLLGVHPNYLHRLIRNLNLKDSLKA